VAAVLNSRTVPVVVFGQSYGGVAALEATYRTDRIARLMLYEPPLHERVATTSGWRPGWRKWSGRRTGTGARHVSDGDHEAS
jgi:pimeloyl-ACP methyl ester carboxylesterase